MSSDIARRIAQPGDPDLDCDVDGLTVTAVVVNGCEILLRLVDGYGQFVDSVTGEMTRPDMRVTDMDVRMRFPDMPGRVFADYVAQLEQWRDQATPLRMCCAPGRMTTLIEDRNRFLPLPRRQEEGNEERQP